VTSTRDVGSKWLFVMACLLVAAAIFYGAFFSEVPALPARAVVPVREMHRGSHIEIQAVAFLSLGR
jgi:enamine deaminase RidA (YjgF/YER057c/UK114 family)